MKKKMQVDGRGKWMKFQCKRGRISDFLTKLV